MIIKHIRQQKGLSLRALAAKAKMSYTYLCNIENEKADPSLSTLRNLAKALGVTLVELLADEKPRSAGTRNVKRKSAAILFKKKGR